MQTCKSKANLVTKIANDLPRMQIFGKPKISSRVSSNISNPSTTITQRISWYEPPRTCNLKSVINSDVPTSRLPIPVRITQRDKNITTNQRGKPRHNCISIPRKTIINNDSNMSSFKVMLPSFL